MNGNSDQIRGKLSTKIVNTMLAIILVLGLSPLSKASASVVNDSAKQSAEQSQQVAVEAADDTTAGAADSANSGSAASGNGSADTATGSAAAGSAASGSTNTVASNTSGNASSSAATPADQSANFVTGGGASGAVTENGTVTNNTQQPATQNADDGVAVQSEVYNPDAESRNVTKGLSVTIYKDKEFNEALGDEAVSADTVLYGKININFSSDEAPTLASPNISYALPTDQIDVPNQGPSTLYDGDNNVAGSWSIKDGVAYLKYNEDWLKTHVSNKTAFLGFDFTLADVSKGDDDSSSINFGDVNPGWI